MTTAEVKVSMFQLLRDAFFLGHLSIAVKCYFVIRPDLPDLRLIFLDARY